MSVLCRFGIHRVRETRTGLRFPDWYVGNRTLVGRCTRCGIEKVWGPHRDRQQWRQRPSLADIAAEARQSELPETPPNPKPKASPNPEKKLGNR